MDDHNLRSRSRVDYSTLNGGAKKATKSNKTTEKGKNAVNGKTTVVDSRDAELIMSTPGAKTGELLSLETEKQRLDIEIEVVKKKKEIEELKQQLNKQLKSQPSPVTLPVKKTPVAQQEDADLQAAIDHLKKPRDCRGNPCYRQFEGSTIGAT